MHSPKQGIKQVLDEPKKIRSQGTLTCEPMSWRSPPIICHTGESRVEMVQYTTRLCDQEVEYSLEEIEYVPNELRELRGLPNRVTFSSNLKLWLTKHVGSA